MKKEKQIQIPEGVFRLLLAYFEPSSRFHYNEDFEQTIIKALNDKHEKIIAHELFSLYKREPTGAEREAYRRQWLDHIGKPRDERNEEESPAPEPPEDWNG